MGHVRWTQLGHLTEDVKGIIDAWCKNLADSLDPVNLLSVTLHWVL